MIAKSPGTDSASLCTIIAPVGSSGKVTAVVTLQFNFLNALTS